MAEVHIHRATSCLGFLKEGYCMIEAVKYMPSFNAFKEKEPELRPKNVSVPWVDFILTSCAAQWQSLSLAYSRPRFHPQRHSNDQPLLGAENTTVPASHVWGHSRVSPQASRNTQTLADPLTEAQALHTLTLLILMETLEVFTTLVLEMESPGPVLAHLQEVEWMFSFWSLFVSWIPGLSVCPCFHSLANSPMSGSFQVSMLPSRQEEMTGKYGVASFPTYNGWRSHITRLLSIYILFHLCM